MPRPYPEGEYYIIDNKGFVDGAHPTFGSAMSAAKDLRDDPDFKSAGNMALVKVEMLLDNFMNFIDTD